MIVQESIAAGAGSRVVDDDESVGAICFFEILVHCAFVCACQKISCGSAT